jgi:DNA-directed RNA polymerase subunit L
MDVKNIKINDYSIKYDKSKYKSIIEKNIHLLPLLSKQGIQFELINSNEAFSNAIRRIFNDELLIKCLHTHIFDIKTDDKYILHDTIIERINSISINQKIDDDIIFHINVINNTNDIIKIYSKDIINKKNKNDTNIYFNPNILICTLKPNKYLYINDIKIHKDYGFNNHIYSIGSFSYEIINTNFQELSLNNDCKDFRIELINNSNIELSYLINEIYNNLYFRLKKIQQAINEYQLEKYSSDINKILNEIFIIKNNNIFEIHINNEYHTIGNLLTYYIYNILNSIELINYKLEHPLRHKIIIYIKHNNYKQLFNDAINNIIKDLDIFKKILTNEITKLQKK